jgi:hypothetical protein
MDMYLSSFTTASGGKNMQEKEMDAFGLLLGLYVVW